jgi:predicted RND superfamily exporter protein
MGVVSIDESREMLRPYLEIIVRFRWLVLVIMVAITAGLLTQAKNLKIIFDPNNIVPQSHPFVATTNKVEEVFGSRYVAVIGITANGGNIFQENILGKVQRITQQLRQTPRVVKSNLLSLSAKRTKDIIGIEDGMSVKQMMPAIPETPAEMAHLKAALERNTAYRDSIVSRDWRTTAIIVEMREGEGGFRKVIGRLHEIVDAERDDTVEISIGGSPVFLASIEKYATRIAFLFPLAVLIVGLIHFEAFRTVQGLILPLVTPLFAVIWALGIMGAANVPLDIFNTTTPILILAVGAGHAVQLLKRYYEEYNRLREDPSLSPKQANHRAVVESITRIGPVMLTAGGVAATSFFSLMVFDIISIRVFGIFTGMGILSVLLLEMTFIPALRSILPAPSAKEARLEREERVWDRLTGFYAGAVLGPNRNRIFVIALVVAAVAVVGMSRLRVESSLKNYFSVDLPVRVDDSRLNERLAGTNSIFVLVDGQEPDAIKDPAVLKAMDGLQALLAEQPHIGKTLSIADFIKQMNQALNRDDPAYYKIPDNRNTIAEYLFLYSISGEPGDFDPYVDYDYQLANLVIYMKIDSTSYTEQLADLISEYAGTHFPPTVKVSIGGSAPQAAAITEVIVQDKILNVVQIACVVLLIASLVFRSFLAGILVVTPLLLAVLFNMGLMGMTGMTLNVPSALISALAIGIGADYAIYMLFRLREEVAKTTDEEQAFRNVFRTAGKACLYVASAVAGGYAVQAFSRGYNPHTWSAMLIGSAMIVSVTAALTVMPALVRLLRPKFIFNGAHAKQ